MANGKEVRNTVKRFLFIGPSCHCPCCDRPIPIKLGYTLQRVDVPRPEIDAALVKTMFQYALDHGTEIHKYVNKRNSVNGFRARQDTWQKRIQCSCGKTKSAALYWVEIDPGIFAGPWCDWCFRREEYKIWRGRPSNARLFALHAPQALKFLSDQNWIEATAHQDEEDPGILEEAEEELPPEAGEPIAEEIEYF